MSNVGDINLVHLCYEYEGRVVVSLWGSTEITEGVIEGRLHQGLNDTWWVKDVLIALSDEEGMPVAVPALRYLVPVGDIKAA